MFGLDAQVQEKRVGDRTSRWIVRVDTRRPGAPRTHLKTVQRVKVEITAQHPDDRSVAQAVSPYPRIVPHWSLSIPTESSLAVVGQKLQALPSSIAERRNPRYRDIWDIAEFPLRGAGDRRRAVRIARKTAGRNGIADLRELADAAIAKLPELVHGGAFRRAMEPFLDERALASRIGDADSREGMVATVGAALGLLRDGQGSTDGFDLPLR